MTRPRTWSGARLPVGEGRNQSSWADFERGIGSCRIELTPDHSRDGGRCGRSCLPAPAAGPVQGVGCGPNRKLAVKAAPAKGGYPLRQERSGDDGRLRPERQARMTATFIWTGNEPFLWVISNRRTGASHRNREAVSSRKRVRL
jgi:hypothetical protein